MHPKNVSRPVAFIMGSEGWAGVHVGDIVTVDANGKLVVKEGKRVEDKTAVPGIREVMIEGKAMILVWEDGVKTYAVCGERDQFDPFVGFCIAYAKRMLGSKENIKNLMKCKNLKEIARKEREALEAEEKALREKEEKEVHRMQAEMMEALAEQKYLELMAERRAKKRLEKEDAAGASVTNGEK